jgi:tetraacyldisaccharide 4'-kinase
MYSLKGEPYNLMKSMGIPEYLYYIGLSAKKSWSLRHQRKLPCVVVSIGNITVGGTGKTPAVIALATEAKIRGFSPIILTRGYKGSLKGPSFVTMGDGPLLDPGQAGDEPSLMAERLKGVPVVKGADRYEAGLFALQNSGSHLPSIDSRCLFILDDGFQHWKLYRDIDVLLVDSENPFGNYLLLPRGILREPLDALKRSNIIVLTKCKKTDLSLRPEIGALISEIKKFNADAPIFFAGHSVSGIQMQDGGALSPGWLREKKIFCFCALGNPESFRRSMLEAGAVITEFKAFRDHHLYSEDDLSKIKTEADKSGAEWIVTTEKDMIKLSGVDLPGNLIIIKIEFSADKEFYDAVFTF